MKQAFIYPGGPDVPDRPKAVRWGITRLFWEARDPKATAALLSTFKQAGMGVGLMRDPSWTGLNGTQLAEAMHQDLTDKGFGPSTGPDSCAAMFDMEAHGNQNALDMLTRWRQLRATRTTLWTLESFQGGWMEPSLVAKINSDPNLLIVPQIYLGSPRMYPTDQHAAIMDLANRGIRLDRIVSFYDGERTIPYGWNGLIYDFIKLPAQPPITL